MFFSDSVFENYMFYDLMFGDFVDEDELFLYSILIANKNKEEIKNSDDNSEDGYSSKDYCSKLYEDFDY